MNVCLVKLRRTSPQHMCIICKIDKSAEIIKLDFDGTYLVSGDIRPETSFKYLINLKNDIDFSILHKEGLPKSALGISNPKIFLSTGRILN